MIKATFDIRRAFVDYFKSNRHKVLSSAPLVPTSDQTLMFTNAGMVQFKNVFTGQSKRPAPCAATVQKCIRISGKHNDLENVGRTSRHHTFFEMLGNFSFGDYFKRDALEYGWGFLTETLKLDPNQLWVSVFAGDETAPADEEAYDLWANHIGVPQERIFRCGAKDNFWSMGDTGPCGPCSEVHFDRGDAFGPADLTNGERYFELWNLVFMQYQVDTPGGPLKPLPAPCIDTGAGLERIASVLQGVDSNYDIDVFKPLVEKAASQAGTRYGAAPATDVSLRVIADHARMTAFLISEGIFPEKTYREYVLRRVMRRAIRHGHRLGIDNLFMHEIAKTVVEIMHGAYPELTDRVDLIDRVCRQEEERFRETLGRGLELLSTNEEWTVGPDGAKTLPGEIAFDLTATYGFPMDLIEVIGRDEGFTVDEKGYEEAKKRHQSISGAGKIGDEAVAPVYDDLLASVGQTEFVGYEGERASAQVLAIVRDKQTVPHATKGQEVEVVLEVTPFYGAAGGQVGDTGTLSWTDGSMTVSDTQRPLPGLVVHRGTVETNRLRVGDPVEAVIDGDRRLAIRRHHTATHLLHLALREVLGAHATQKGSRVAADSLRFDFAHFEPLSAAQLAQIEERVYGLILQNHAVDTAIKSYTEARESGAVALFEENYGDMVRLVTISPESRELCGGTHVAATGEIGSFYIVSETGIAAGVRRIEAVAGHAAQEWISRGRQVLANAAHLLKADPQAIVAKLEKALANERALKREINQLQRKLNEGGEVLSARVRPINGIKVLGARLDVGDPAVLRDTVDTLKQRLGSAIICLGGEHRKKGALLVAVTEDLVERFDARQLIREVAAVIGGKGGGRADLAQAGGPKTDQLDAAVEKIYDAIARATESE